MKQITVISLIGLVLIIMLVGVTFLEQNKLNNQKGNVKVIFMKTKQFEYIPNQITVNLGDKVVLTIFSEDVTHGFQLPEFGIYNVPTPGGQNTTITFVANKKGTFQFYCSVPCGTGHINHKGKITVL